jgi:hypothetical protein
LSVVNFGAGFGLRVFLVPFIQGLMPNEQYSLAFKNQTSNVEISSGIHWLINDDLS